MRMDIQAERGLGTFEDGVGFAVYSRIAWPGIIEATRRCIHVTERGVQRIKSPLDNLKL